MFTGLVEELASVVRVDVRQSGANIELGARRIMQDMSIGDSIAVNGVCLTVVKFNQTTFTLDAVPETIRKTNLDGLKPGRLVHVERAIAANGRFGGHLVTGHIDGVGFLQNRVQEGMAQIITVAAPPEIMKYVMAKGSICIDGVSLTVMNILEEVFQVSMIPHTGQVTTLSNAPIGSRLNLECDVLAKYVERMLQASMNNAMTKTGQGSDSTINIDFLTKHGFV